MKTKLKNLFKNKIFLTIFLSGLIFVIILLFANSLTYLDKKIIYQSLFTKNSIIHFKANKDIVIIQIDNKTLNKFSYPLSRNIYAQAITNLKNAGVSVIGIDVIFGEKSNDLLADKNLEKAIKQAGNVIIGSGIDGKIFYLPYKPFRKVAYSYGFFNPKIDKRTNVVYSIYPSLKLQTNNFIEKKIHGKIQKVPDNRLYTINYFPIEILKKYLNIQKIDKNNIGIKFGDLFQVPYSKLGSNEILLNFLPKSKFYNYSLLDIYNNNFSKENLKGKIVIIGATADGLKDTFNTPNGIDYGVYIHANTINTILSGKYLVYFNSFLEFVLIFLLIIFSIYLNLFNNNKLIIGNISIFTIFILIPLGLILTSNLIIEHPASLILAFILSIAFSNIAKYLIENKTKKKVLKALGEYISKDVAKKILSSDSGIMLDGEKKKISIFFSDIAGFTTISEKMDAIELVEFLREYLGKMSNIIMDEHGFINKYEGDAIMALFGVFSYENSSNYDNCKSALLQQEALKILNQKWQKKYGEILKVRMGLHFGEAIVGNIGAVGRKMEFTALGDSVNLASRLEGVNKFYNTNICVSENVYNDQKENFEFRKLDKIKVKGKDKAITIYELLGFKGKISKLKQQIKIDFEKALELYFNQEFKKAGEIFKNLGNLGDTTSIIFEKRCLQFEINSPGKTWDGVWTMKSK